MPPASGVHEECRFDAVGSCTWALFCPDGEERWAGVFGRGAAGRDGLAVSDSGRTACVLAGGTAYVVDLTRRVLRRRVDGLPLQSVVAVPGGELFVVADFTELHACSANGLEWSSGRVSVDGIRLGAADAQRLEGEVWTMEEWVPFSLAFEGWRFECRWSCPF